MKKNMDTLLKSTLKPSSFPNPDLNELIMKQAKENEMMRQRRKKSIYAAALFACAITLSGVSVYAAYRFLSPAQIAGQVSEGGNLSKAFEGENAITLNETQTSNGYRITLLGLTSGANLSPYVEDSHSAGLEDVRTYATFAIVREDGQSIDSENKCISPLINGVSLHIANNATLNAGLHWFYQDGVLYELLECDNLEVFAKMGVQVGVVDSFGDEIRAFTMDSNTGIYSQNTEYSKTNALFTIPLDEAKGDNEKAGQLIKEMEQSVESGTSAGDEEMSATPSSKDVDAFIASLTDENLDTYAQPIVSTKMICTPDAEGIFTYSYELPSGVDGNGSDSVSNLFPDRTIGIRKIGGYGYSEGLHDLLIDTFILNKDGTITYQVYTPVLQE